MGAQTLRILNGKPERLRRLPESRGMSMNRLVDEWAMVAPVQFDAETRFRALAARGNAAPALEIWDGAAAAARKPRHRKA